MLQESRPVMVPAKKTIDIFFEVSAILIIIFMWAYCFYHFASLPEIIPTHYGFNGKPDDYGSKSTIFLIPGIVTALVLLLRFLNRFPHRFNYMTVITEENAERQYRMATRLLRYIQFIISFLFLFIVVKTVQDSYLKDSKLGMGFLFILIPAIFVPTVYTVYSSLVKKK